MKRAGLLALLVAAPAIAGGGDERDHGHESHGPYEGKHEPRLYGLHDACEHEIADPVATPIHDAGIDDQRAACLRTEFGTNLTTHALIDTPNFHGFLGAELALDVRHVVGSHVELGARLRVFDYGFVQTAVNKVTEKRYGPVLVSAAYGTKIAPSAHVGVIVAVEAPFTRNEMETRRTGGELTGLFTGALSDRWTLHGRMGALGTSASSDGGSLQRLALRGGFDVAWRTRGNRVGVISGLESQAGFTDGLDMVMVRQQLQVHVGHLYRAVAALGIRLTGSDSTNAIFVVGFAREIER